MSQPHRSQMGQGGILILQFSIVLLVCILTPFFVSTGQVFNDAIEALRISYRKMNPFCVPFATTNMGSAMLAMDLVSPLIT